MKITWLGHSCMKLCENGYSVVCDPYKPGSVPGFELKDVSADAVFCSHEHADHSGRQLVALRRGGARPFSVTAVPAWHDACGGAQRGPNVIRVFDSDFGVRAVHLGDLGEELTDDQISAIGTPDVLMIPVGGTFTIDAKQAKKLVSRLSPSIVIPMHYRGAGFGYDVLDTVDAFTSLFEPSLVRLYDTNSIGVDDDTPRQIAVLKYL